jgi:hypothetical protein
MIMGHRSHEALGGLFPLTGPAAVRHFLARSEFDRTEEQEAELLASLVLAHAGWDVPVGVFAADASAEAAAMLERLSRAFGPQG